MNRVGFRVTGISEDSSGMLLGYCLDHDCRHTNTFDDSGDMCEMCWDYEDMPEALLTSDQFFAIECMIDHAQLVCTCGSAYIQAIRSVGANIDPRAVLSLGDWRALTELVLGKGGVN